MKVLFIVYCELKSGVGISKKIKAQNQALINNGLKSDIHHWGILPNGHRVSYINDFVYKDYGNGFIGKLKVRLCRMNIVDYIIKNQITHVYIRYEFFADYLFLLLLKKITKNGVYVILEVPTYPYDNELNRTNILNRIFFIIEKKCREKMHNYVRKIVTYSNNDVIFHIPTVRISNGIDFNTIPSRVGENKVERKITLIGVANMAFWHGYDRLIKGISKYLQQGGEFLIHFNIVGEGDEVYRNQLRQLVKDLSLENIVSFYDNTDGNDLTKLFEDSNVAIGSLARHRSGIYQLKTLKNVEYAARGIPFIYSEKDDNFDHMEYILKVSADESPIDIEKVISFYFSQEWNSNSIRASVENTLSWTKQMEKVIESMPKRNNI